MAGRAAPRSWMEPVGRRAPQPCRVTNTSEEIYRQVGVDELEQEKFIKLPNIQVPDPEQGPLEKRVKKNYLEEMFNDTGPDLQETAYWFHTPPDGWNKKPLVVAAADEAPVNFPEPLHLDAQATGRVPLSELREGMEVEGELTDMWLYHGCQIDIGAEWDGLVPISAEEWMQEGVRGAVLPGDRVRVRIHRVLPPHLYRWPLQLEVLEPEGLAELITHPDDYLSPVDLAWCADQGWTEEQILEATGRTYDPPVSFSLPAADEIMEDIQRRMGYDVEELDVPNHCEVEERVLDTYSPLIEEAGVDLATSDL